MDEPVEESEANPRSGSATVPRALTIAGSDSGGGGGIQADLRTFAALGVWGTSAITSVTVQNTLGVTGVADVPARVVGEQIRSVLGDIGADAAKTGMLSSAAIIEQVAAALHAHPVPVVVVDPVFVSKHGAPLLHPEAVASLRALILPLATLVTPNLPEAAGLVGFDVATREDMRRAADAILGLGAHAVLLKGGHLEADPGRSDDLFAQASGVAEWVEGERIASANTHGTGCTLSAAIAAYSARGRDLRTAVVSGKAFVTEAIRHGAPVGAGIGPVDPAWEAGRGARRREDD